MDATTGSVTQASSTGIQAGALPDASQKTTEESPLSPGMSCLVAAIDARARSIFEEVGDADAKDLVRALARTLAGQSLRAAFGAPGDWGYGTPIGMALARVYSERADGPAPRTDAAGAAELPGGAELSELIAAACELAGESIHVTGIPVSRICGRCNRGGIGGEPVVHAERCVIGRVLRAVAAMPRVAGETQIPFGNDKGTGRVPEDDLASPMPERVTVCGGMRPRTGWESDARPALTCDQPIGHEVSTPELRHWNREHGESWPTASQRGAAEAWEIGAAR